MSHLGRLSARAGGVAAPRLAPAGPLSSPYARIDQRLNVLAERGLPLDQGKLIASRETVETRDGGMLDAPADRVDAPGAPRSSRHASIERAPEPRARPSLEPAELGVRGDASAREAHSVVTRRDVVDATPANLLAARHEDRIIAPPEAAPLAVASPDATTRRALSPRTRAERELAEDPAPVAARRASERRAVEPAPVPSERTAERPAARPAQTQDVKPAADGPAADRGSRALEKALASVDAWMRRAPQDPKAPATKNELAPSVESRRPSAQAPGLSSSAMSAPTRRAPTLTIGSIDVRVVPPVTPSVAPSPERRRTASAVPAASATPAAPAHLTFGLRQR